MRLPRTRLGRNLRLITVACVLRSGGIYTPEHVRILEAMVSRNLDSIDRFVCLTDLALDLPHVEPIKLHHNWPGTWSKLELFRPIFDEGERILYIDLSTVICGNLAGIARQTAPFIAVSSSTRRLSSEVLMWTGGDTAGESTCLGEVYRRFARNPRLEMTDGQRIDLVIAGYAMYPDYWTDLVPGQVVSWSADCWDGLPPDARIVTFPGAVQPWNCSDEWVREHYTAEVSA